MRNLMRRPYTAVRYSETAHIVRTQCKMNLGTTEQKKRMIIRKSDSNRAMMNETEPFPTEFVPSNEHERDKIVGEDVREDIPASEFEKLPPLDEIASELKSLEEQFDRVIESAVDDFAFQGLSEDDGKVDETLTLDDNVLDELMDASTLADSSREDAFWEESAEYRDKSIQATLPEDREFFETEFDRAGAVDKAPFRLRLHRAGNRSAGCGYVRNPACYGQTFLPRPYRP